MDKEATLDAVEASLDVVEEQAEVVQKGASKLGGFLRSPKVLVGVTLVTVAAGSAYAGYKYAQKVLEPRYEKLIEEEVEKARNHYYRLYKLSDDTKDPVEVLGRLHGQDAVEEVNAEVRQIREKRERVRYHEISTPAGTVSEETVEEDIVVKEDPTKDPDMPEPDEEDEALEALARQRAETRLTQRQEDDEVVVINDETPIVTPIDFDYDVEVLLRTNTHPYIITEDEYYQAEKGYTQISISYFQGDQTLVDDQDDPIHNIDQVVGLDNLEKFGHGSRDQNTVYIRNEHREVDYEVTRSSGKYAHEILGHEAEIRHSDTRGVRKFRTRDE